MRKYLMIKSNIKQRLECLDINKLEKLIWKRGRFMKDGEFAIYLGREYSAGETQEGKIVLRSTDIEDVKNGFEPCKPFNIRYVEDKIVCMKYVNSSEITEYYILRTMAIYKGFEFEVVETDQMTEPVETKKKDVERPISRLEQFYQLESLIKERGVL